MNTSVTFRKLCIGELKELYSKVYLNIDHKLHEIKEVRNLNNGLEIFRK